MRYFSILLATILIHGCASVGQSEFTCSGIPDGTRCEPSSNLYNEVDKQSFDTKNKASDGSESRAKVKIVPFFCFVTSSILMILSPILH